MRFDRVMTTAFLVCSAVVAFPTARTLWSEWRASRPKPPVSVVYDPIGFGAARREVMDSIR